ncbi:MAG: efflux RND transporter periplasmic adaptor subunit [Pseudomonadota bacterium]
MDSLSKPTAARRAAAALSLLFLSAVSTAALAQDRPAPAVIVAEVTTGDIADRLEALGTARATESVTVTSVLAERVIELGFDDGDRVTEGQVLARLDNRIDAANLERARVTLRERRNALERAENLAAKNLASAENLDAARLAAQQAAAEVTGLEAQVDRHIIRAPFDGTVGLRMVSVGALVSPGDVITTLDDTRQIKLDFPVPAIHLTKLAPGQRVSASLDASGVNPVEGVVATVGSRVDPVTRSVVIRAVLDNRAGDIRPGMLMRVALESNPRTALIVPESALMPRGKVQNVFVIGADNTAELREITIGARTPGKVEVLAGLSDGERVVTDGIDKVRNGRPVTVRAVSDGSRSLTELLSQTAAP